MRNLRIASRYAKALLSLAEENQIIDEAYESMSVVLDVFEKNRELKVLLSSPIVRESRKVNIVQKIFENKVNKLILKYLLIITRKKRSFLIEPIAVEYKRLHKLKLNIETVTVTTAHDIDDEIKGKVIKVARHITDKKIEFQNIVDLSIIGGFILKIGDYYYDASIRRSLINIKKKLYHSDEW